MVYATRSTGVHLKSAVILIVIGFITKHTDCRITIQFIVNMHSVFVLFFPLRKYYISGFYIPNLKVKSMQRSGTEGTRT